MNILDVLCFFSGPIPLFGHDFYSGCHNNTRGVKFHFQTRGVETRVREVDPWGRICQARREACTHEIFIVVCCLAQQTLSAVSHSRQCLLYHTADMSAVSPCRHVCCITQQTCPALPHNRHCPLCHAADMSAASDSWIPSKSNLLVSIVVPFLALDLAVILWIMALRVCLVPAPFSLGQ